ncbi:hypothetical protein [Actinoplanes campanulatus]|uniref:hypothetical protein n=1 Tax=Actinoplanes campanulatus TaxID=113559 RepID=UPI001953A3D5|nr:hypothetical protein [Actinoplanes capillaceus]
MSLVPPPPPGPGVHPPFPAPPVEGRGKRIGTSLGITAGILVLICGAGVVAAGGFLTAFGNALDEQAEVVVSRYLDDLQDRDFDGAYQQLCQQAQDSESQSDYVARMAASEPFSSYRLGELALGVRIVVPVDLLYPDGGSARQEAVLGQNKKTGKFEVCDLGE